MTAPSLIAYSETTWTGFGAKSTGSVSWNAGDVVVVVGGSETSVHAVTLPTFSGGTFAAISGAACTAGSDCYANAWSCIPAGSGSGAVSSTGTGGGYDYGIAVWVWRGSGGIGNVGASGATANTNITQSLIRSGGNSCVVGGMFDWGAGAVTGYAWTPSAANDRQHAKDGSRYTYYVADWGDQGSSGTTSYGLTGISGNGALARLFVEILGTATSGATVTMGSALAVATAPRPGGPPGPAVTAARRRGRHSPARPGCPPGPHGRPGGPGRRHGPAAPVVRQDRPPPRHPGRRHRAAESGRPVGTPPPGGPGGHHRPQVPLVRRGRSRPGRPGSRHGPGSIRRCHGHPGTLAVTARPAPAAGGNATAAPAVLAFSTAQPAAAVTATRNATAAPAVLAVARPSPRSRSPRPERHRHPGGPGRRHRAAGSYVTTRGSHRLPRRPGRRDRPAPCHRPGLPGDLPRPGTVRIRTFSAIGSSDTIEWVQVAVTEHQSDNAQAPCTFELWDYSGTPARIGTAQTGTASTSTGNISSALFTGVTYAQLATLRVRIYGHSDSPGLTESADGANLTISYSPAADTGHVLASTVTATVTIPAPAVRQDRTAAPATAAVSTAQPAVTVTSGNATASPAVLAVTTSVPFSAAGSSVSITLIADNAITAAVTDQPARHRHHEQPGRRPPRPLSQSPPPSPHRWSGRTAPPPRPPWPPRRLRPPPRSRPADPLPPPRRL